jgi:hypothetical protein
LLLAILVTAVFLAGSAGLLSLQGVAIASFGIQLLTAYQIIRVRDRALSISSAFAVLWIIFFPLRLLVITFGGPSVYYFPSVNAASPQQLISVWEVTTAAPFLFLIGQLFAIRTFPAKRSVDNILIRYGQSLAVGVVGLCITAVLFVFNASSGILSNIGQLVLFAIADISYREATERRRPYASVSLVAAAVTLGYVNGFKELMLMPVGAWVIGRAGAGGRVRVRYIVIVAVAAVVAFGIIQGERNAAIAGRSVSNPIAALQVGLADYDLAHGYPTQYQGVGIIGNVVNGILFRLKGVDYYIVITDKVPSSIPYQGGRSLWEPALSILPGAKQFLNLDPQYRQLSLGRYIDQVFVSEGPTTDPSSQSATEPGDLYLNFGIPGVAVGMLVLGMLYGIFDRGFTVRGPVSAGVAAYAGLPLLPLDGNVAYILVTCGLRLGICAVFLSWLSSSQRMAARRERVEPVRG